MKIKSNPEHSIRLDKWLWAARLYKTRTLAREMIVGGKVHCNGQRTKPGKLLELGSTITLRQGSDQRTVIVIRLDEQRRGAEHAQQLYQETEQSIITREKMALVRKINAFTAPHPQRRPDKKARRDLIHFRQHLSSTDS